jgi:hypothetical protein
MHDDREECDVKICHVQCRQSHTIINNTPSLSLSMNSSDNESVTSNDENNESSLVTSDGVAERNVNGKMRPLHLQFLEIAFGHADKPFLARFPLFIKLVETQKPNTVNLPNVGAHRSYTTNFNGYGRFVRCLNEAKAKLAPGQYPSNRIDEVLKQIYTKMKIIPGSPMDNQFQQYICGLTRESLTSAAKHYLTYTRLWSPTDKTVVFKILDPEFQMAIGHIMAKKETKAREKALKKAMPFEIQVQSMAPAPFVAPVPIPAKPVVTVEPTPVAPVQIPAKPVVPTEPTPAATAPVVTPSMPVAINVSWEVKAKRLEKELAVLKNENEILQGMLMKAMAYRSSDGSPDAKRAKVQ